MYPSKWWILIKIARYITNARKSVTKLILYMYKMIMYDIDDKNPLRKSLIFNSNARINIKKK